MENLLKKTLWALPSGGLLLLISVLLRGMVIDPSADPNGFALFVNSDTFQIGATLTLFHFVILFIGVISLGLLLLHYHNTLPSRLGILCFFISHCLTFTYLGLLAFAYQKSIEVPTVQPFAIFDLFNPSINKAILPVIIVDTATYFAGIVFTCFAMAKSKMFPTYVWGMFGLSFLLVGIIPPATLAANPSIARVSELIGNVLIVVSGIQIATIFRKSRIA